MTLRVRIFDAENREKHALRAASTGVEQRLVDRLDEAEIAVPWLACRSARCGVCRVFVLEDTEALVPAEADERATLHLLRAAPDERLACQLRIRAHAHGELRLRTEQGAAHRE